MDLDARVLEGDVTLDAASSDSPPADRHGAPEPRAGSKRLSGFRMQWPSPTSSYQPRNAAASATR